MKVVLFESIDVNNIIIIDKYKKLGFTFNEEDSTIMECNHKGHDLASVYGMMDDCIDYGLKPNVNIDGMIYNFDEGFKIVDELSGDDVYTDGIGTLLT